MIEPFDREKHAAMVAEWHASRGQTATTAELVGNQMFYPPTGFVAPTAALWVYLTNGPQAYLEHAISDPKAPVEARRADLVSLIAVAEAFAAKHGALFIIGATHSEAAVSHLKDSGFVETNETYRYRHLVKLMEARHG